MAPRGESAWSAPAVQKPAKSAKAKSAPAKKIQPQSAPAEASPMKAAKKSRPVKPDEVIPLDEDEMINL